MLGNVAEWCQDRALQYRPGGTAMTNDNIHELEYVNEKNPRLLRGGAFNIQPALVRSAFRIRFTPATRYINLGFRPSRTYLHFPRKHRTCGDWARRRERRFFDADR